MLRGLRTHSLHVSDLTAASAWYAKVLGVAPYFDQPFYVGFNVGGYELGLQPADDDHQAGVGGGLAMWGVGDVPAALARLIDLGATLRDGAQNVGGDIVVASVIDPFGNALGLIYNPHFQADGRLYDEDAGMSGGVDDASDRAIVLEAVVAASPSALWPMWTTTEGVTSWMVDRAKIELRVGGPFEVYFMTDAPVGSQGSEGCRVLSFIPGRMLSFTWNAPPHLATTRKQHTWVVVELDAVDGGTRVRITHTGWPASGWTTDGSQWPDTFAYFESAWPRMLEALTAAV